MRYIFKAKIIVRSNARQIAVSGVGEKEMIASIIALMWPIRNSHCCYDRPMVANTKFHVKLLSLYKQLTGIEPERRLSSAFVPYPAGINRFYLSIDEANFDVPHLGGDLPHKTFFRRIQLLPILERQNLQPS